MGCSCTRALKVRAKSGRSFLLISTSNWSTESIERSIKTIVSRIMKVVRRDTAFCRVALSFTAFRFLPYECFFAILESFARSFTAHHAPMQYNVAMYSKPAVRWRRW